MKHNCVWDVQSPSVWMGARYQLIFRGSSMQSQKRISERLQGSLKQTTCFLRYAGVSAHRKHSVRAPVSSGKKGSQFASVIWNGLLLTGNERMALKRRRTAPATGKHVAVVGSGPAGITAASECLRAGHEVTIFESLHAAGGVLTYGIPAFRMPKDIVKFEIEQVLGLGAELKLNHIVGRSVAVDELLAYDAVFIGTGAGLPYFMGLEGENYSGVYSANEFLTRVNLMHADKFPEFDTPIIRGSRVAVVGGGNVAMDAARVARRLGAKVYLIYRRREEDLPAREEEVANAVQEGIEFVCCANPTKILGGPEVRGIECSRMDMCELDESGRPIPRPCTGEGSTFTLDVDVVIEAIGQGPNPLLAGLVPDLKRGRRGTIEVDEDGRTSIPHVFAGGDIATGAATVIWAMGSAKKAAASINKMLAEN